MTTGKASPDGGGNLSPRPCACAAAQWNSAQASTAKRAQERDMSRGFEPGLFGAGAKIAQISSDGNALF
jgi:hypothetical protein